jgi:hypothetical protein
MKKMWTFYLAPETLVAMKRAAEIRRSPSASEWARQILDREARRVIEREARKVTRRA